MASVIAEIRRSIKEGRFKSAREEFMARYGV
jgi:queuine/archaeosine tRNA-ribosyltransferase